MYYYKDECFFQHQDIAYSQYSYHGKTYEHKHDFFEVAYVANGEGNHYINSRCVKLKKGDYVILDTDVTHCYEGDIEIVNVIFKPKLLDKTYRDLKTVTELYNLITINSGYSMVMSEPVYYIFHDDGTILEKLYYIRDEIEKKELGYIECTKAVLIGIIMQSLRSICREELSGSEDCPVKFIEKHIYEHYDEDVNLSALCDELGYSVSYISKRFKHITGNTFSDYLKRTRIQFACRILLENPDMRIEDAAAAVGYSDIKYFSALFKRYMGKTPAVFRRLFKHK